MKLPRRKLMIALIALAQITFILITLTYGWIEGGRETHAGGAGAVQDGLDWRAMSTVYHEHDRREIDLARFLEEHLNEHDNFMLTPASSVDGVNFFFPMGNPNAADAAERRWRQGTPDDFNVNYIHFDFILEAAYATQYWFDPHRTLTAEVLVGNSPNEALSNAVRMGVLVETRRPGGEWQPEMNTVLSHDAHRDAMPRTPVRALDPNDSTAVRAPLPTQPSDTTATAHYNHHTFDSRTFDAARDLRPTRLMALPQGHQARVSITYWLEESALPTGFFTSPPGELRLNLAMHLTTSWRETIEITFLDNTVHGYAPRGQHWVSGNRIIARVSDEIIQNEGLRQTLGVELLPHGDSGHEWRGVVPVEIADNLQIDRVANPPSEEPNQPHWEARLNNYFHAPHRGARTTFVAVMHSYGVWSRVDRVGGHVSMLDYDFVDIHITDGPGSRTGSGFITRTLFDSDYGRGDDDDRSRHNRDSIAPWLANRQHLHYHTCRVVLNNPDNQLRACSDSCNFKDWGWFFVATEIDPSLADGDIPQTALDLFYNTAEINGPMARDGSQSRLHFPVQQTQFERFNDPNAQGHRSNERNPFQYFMTIPRWVTNGNLVLREGRHGDDPPIDGRNNAERWDSTWRSPNINRIHPTNGERFNRLILTDVPDRAQVQRRLNPGSNQLHRYPGFNTGGGAAGPAMMEWARFRTTTQIIFEEDQTTWVFGDPIIVARTNRETATSFGAEHPPHMSLRMAMWRTGGREARLEIPNRIEYRTSAAPGYSTTDAPPASTAASRSIGFERRHPDTLAIDSQTWHQWHNNRDRFQGNRISVRFNPRDGRPANSTGEEGVWRTDPQSHIIDYQVNRGDPPRAVGRSFQQTIARHISGQNILTTVFSSEELMMAPRDGYFFAGWNTEQNGSGVWINPGDRIRTNSGGNEWWRWIGPGPTTVERIGTISTANLTLHAQWRPLATITYRWNHAGGPADVECRDRTRQVRHPVGEGAPVWPGTEAPDGLHFIGWNNLANGTGDEWYHPNETPYRTVSHERDIALYAQWDRGIRVEFNTTDPSAVGHFTIAGDNLPPWLHNPDPLGDPVQLSGGRTVGPAERVTGMTFHAIPPGENYRVGNWYINGVALDPEVTTETFSLTTAQLDDAYAAGEVEVGVQIVPIMRTVTFTAVNGTLRAWLGSYGGPVINSGDSVPQGSTIHFRAGDRPGGTEYVISWGGASAGLLDGQAHYWNRNITNIQAPVTITTEFTRAMRQVTFSVVGGVGGALTANGHPVTASPISVPQGSEVTFVAEPNQHFEVQSWTITGGTLSGGATDTERMATAGTDPMVVTVTFVRRHTVTFSAGANGSISATASGAGISSGARVLYGSTVVFTATPNPGFRVAAWTGPGTGTGDTRTITSLTADAHVTVTFESANIRLYYFDFLNWRNYGTLNAHINRSGYTRDFAMTPTGPSTHGTHRGWWFVDIPENYITSGGTYSVIFYERWNVARQSANMTLNTANTITENRRWFVHALPWRTGTHRLSQGDARTEIRHVPGDTVHEITFLPGTGGNTIPAANQRRFVRDTAPHNTLTANWMPAAPTPTDRWNRFSEWRVTAGQTAGAFIGTTAVTANDIAVTAQWRSTRHMLLNYDNRDGVPFRRNESDGTAIRTQHTNHVLFQINDGSQWRRIRAEPVPDGFNANYLVVRMRAANYWSPDRRLRLTQMLNNREVFNQADSNGIRAFALHSATTLTQSFQNFVIHLPHGDAANIRPPSTGTRDITFMVWAGAAPAVIHVDIERIYYSEVNPNAPWP